MKIRGIVQSGVAVFVPMGYDPKPHMPSPIFVKDILAHEALPDTWQMIPRFGRKKKFCGAKIHTGDADLYGLGEVLGNLRRNNDKQYFWNTENPAAFLFDGKKLYQSHPWVLGVRKNGSAFGIIFDTTWESEISTHGGSVVFKTKGPICRVIIIDKENPAEVMKTLADLTGKMELPPMWALGYQQCRYSYYPQEQAESIAFMLRKRRIPCDVIWLDIHYMDQYKIFTFNPKGFNDPEGLNEFLHANNFKSVYMIDPGVKAEEGYFVDDQGREGDYFVRDKNGDFFTGPVWPGTCHFPDFTNPDACKWWGGLYKDFMAKGIDGVWNDMNEPSVFVGFGGTMSKSAVHKGGAEFSSDTHARYHNIYGLLMARASREGIKAANPDKRPFVLSRSNFLGGHRYAAMWTGDNFSDYSQMKAAIPMCLNIGLSGQPFTGPDIGGFLHNCTADLLRHWTASGIYFPFARNHTMTGTVNQEPWAFDNDTEDICRTAIERRYRLMPYYYTLFEEASRTGLPVMRPLFWSNFKDLDLRPEQQAYLVGGDLLVVPRWSDAPVLPKGPWKMFSFEAEDDGYQAYLALRPGAAIPICEVMQSTVDYDHTDITVLVNPDAEGNACGTLYDDAGDGYAYRDGEFARYEFKVSTQNGIIMLKVNKIDGSLERKPRIRLAVISAGQLQYSEWFDSDAATMKLPAENDSFLHPAKLKLTHVIDGSISKKCTKLELILTSFFGASKQE